jgi:hypothetical protein
MWYYFNIHGKTVIEKVRMTMMATALSRNARVSMEVEAYRAHLMCVTLDPDIKDDYDPMRLLIGVTALNSPHLASLHLLTPAWKGATLIIDAYATILRSNEKYLLTEHHTLEEVAVGNVRWAIGEVGGLRRRTLDLATITALHSLNWARQQLRR